MAYQDIKATYKNGKTIYHNTLNGCRIVKSTYLSGNIPFHSYEAIGPYAMSKSGFADPQKAWKWAESMIRPKPAPYAEPHCRSRNKF